MVDIGGGSVQILIGNKNQLKKTFLLKAGAQYLHDTFSPRHTGKDFPTKEEIERMRSYIREQLFPLPNNIKTPVVYGSSCIIDLFKNIGLSLQKTKVSPTHPYKTNVSELSKFLQKIIPIPYDQREEMFKFSQQYYMWGVDKAFLSVLEICQKVGTSSIIPSNANINQGLILSLVRK